MAGASAVVCCTGFTPSLNFKKDNPAKVDHVGTDNLVAAAGNAKGEGSVKKFVLVTSLWTNARAAGQADNDNYKFLNALGGVLDEKLAAELNLRGSGLDYTIVVAGRLVERARERHGSGDRARRRHDVRAADRPGARDLARYRRRGVRRGALRQKRVEPSRGDRRLAGRAQDQPGHLVRVRVKEEEEAAAVLYLVLSYASPVCRLYIGLSLESDDHARVDANATHRRGNEKICSDQSRRFFVRNGFGARRGEGWLGDKRAAETRARARGWSRLVPPPAASRRAWARARGHRRAPRWAAKNNERTRDQTCEVLS